MDLALDIINRPEHTTLQQAFKYIMDNNTSNHAPYHNLSHMLFVMEQCYEASWFHDLNEEDKLTLLFAALWHDYNHSQGELSDEENIKNAQWEVIYFCSENNLSTEFSTAVCEIIKATQYPYVIPTKDLTLSQAIIRDADLLQMTQDDWFQHVIIGLSKEMQVPVKDFIIKQKEFLADVTFNTEWGQRKQEENWNNVMLRLDSLNNTYNGKKQRRKSRRKTNI